MKNLFKTTAVTFMIFTVSTVFAVESNIKRVAFEEVSLTSKDSMQVDFGLSEGDKGFAQFTFERLDSETKIGTFKVIAPNLETNGGNVYFTNNFNPDSDLIFVQADSATADSNMVINVVYGIAKKLPQYAEFTVNAEESFGVYGVDSFTAKPKVWGEVSQVVKGKTKVKKLAAAVISPKKISKNSASDTVLAEVKGTAQVFDKKTLKDLYKKGGSLIPITDTDNIVADSFIFDGSTFDEASINQKAMTVTLKTSAGLPKSASKEERKTVKSGVEVIQYQLVAPEIFGGNFGLVYVDSTARVVADTAHVADSFRLPVITLGKAFTLQLENLGVKTVVKPTRTVYTAKLKGWVENLAVGKRSAVVKKVNIKFDLKSFSVEPNGVAFVEGVIKKLPKNFEPASAGDVTALVIETPTGITAIPVVIQE